MDTNRLILVNEHDEPTGTAEKMEAHEQALLHRAFSVFIFNSKGEMLLQRRADGKYHSPGLWTNACCSHPYEGQDTKAAAEKRLQEEMGFTTALTPVFQFIYKAPFDNGLTEYEYDHVFAGVYDGPVMPDASEVSEYRYQTIESIYTALQEQPMQFTVWFTIAFPKLVEQTGGGAMAT
ncbi:MAG: isopentenyl-diphosphate Delta-isomerase [Bacteroidetes bacterium]|nr:isopentenyl-diphosphate Delta-isomerase [Bacteroidota bacterium]